MAHRYIAREIPPSQTGSGTGYYGTVVVGRGKAKNGDDREGSRLDPNRRGRVRSWRKGLTSIVRYRLVSLATHYLLIIPFGGDSSRTW